MYIEDVSWQLRMLVKQPCNREASNIGQRSVPLGGSTGL